MSSLKQKAITGASWSFLGKLMNQGVQFIIGIILARLLLPEEYGLVAMALVFITILYVFVDSGFSSAIIHKQNIVQADLSTVFYLNFSVGFLVYLMLFFAAPYVAAFYKENQLVEIIRVLSLLIILFSLTLVQNALISKEVNFKLKTRIEIIAQIISGFIGISLALKGLGVWALIWKILLNQVFINIQLWLRNNWWPSFEFSISSFREMFAFSSKLLISGIIDSSYNQVHKLIVGKFFPPAELGYYTRAEQFQNLPSHSISNALMSFLLPVFSKIQNDPIRLKNAATRVIKIVMFINILLMLLIGILAEQIILVLLGEKWIATVPYLQLLIFVGVFYPLHAINVQILTATGRSDLFLRIEIIKKVVGIPSILLGIFVGIKAMILGLIMSTLIALFINTHYTSKLISLSIFEQVRSFRKTIILAICLVVVLYPIISLMKLYFGSLIILITITSLSILMIWAFSSFFQTEEYKEIKSILYNFKKNEIKT